MDEACGITHGASAEFDHCLFRGASKLVLIGSGDKEFAEAEDGKMVTFRNCWFDHFGRRGPEVQSGMVCRMEYCLVTDWGVPQKFDTRAFAAWAHDGGVISAYGCVFTQSIKPTFKQWLKDHLNHIGQAINDHGVLSLFRSDSYVSGYKRACTHDHHGLCGLEMDHCFVQKGLVSEDQCDPMSEDEAFKVVTRLHNYFDALNLVVNPAKSLRGK
ncbi:MAG: hypothetical protein K6G15_00950 [Desulfovibrio sp.]|nr:hypothetical protein [Desulfovibrio sp.]